MLMWNPYSVVFEIPKRHRVLFDKFESANTIPKEYLISTLEIDTVLEIFTTVQKLFILLIARLGLD